jgi:hypothetical protein
LPNARIYNPAALYNFSRPIINISSLDRNGDTFLAH